MRVDLGVICTASVLEYSGHFLTGRLGCLALRLPSLSFTGVWCEPCCQAALYTRIRGFTWLYRANESYDGTAEGAGLGELRFTGPFFVRGLTRESFG